MNIILLQQGLNEQIVLLSIALAAAYTTVSFVGRLCKKI